MEGTVSYGKEQGEFQFGEKWAILSNHWKKLGHMHFTPLWLTATRHDHLVVQKPTLKSLNPLVIWTKVFFGRIPSSLTVCVVHLLSRAWSRESFFSCQNGWQKSTIPFWSLIISPATYFDTLTPYTFRWVLFTPFINSGCFDWGEREGVEIFLERESKEWHRDETSI